MDLAAAAKNRLIEVNELMYLKDGAYKNTGIYKERTKKWHDSRLRGDKDFKVRDKDIVGKKSITLVKYGSSGILAHKINMENLSSNYQGSFSF
uniref:Uncharacterized protein n=1 Tax=Tanacetum cinerariifolium TaxID=118510 RepID=A0A6L2N642_TANCI|nr:hypothetical protein [Tanacetum cinerariifolium]